MRAALALLLAFTLVPSSLAYQNEPDGFRGIKWGADAADFADELVLATEERSTAMYTRRADKLAIGDAELTDIRYFFYKGKFHSVTLTARGNANRRALLNVLRVQFGQGIQPNRYIERHIWSGPVTLISFSCKTTDEDCTLFMTSTESIRQKSLEQKQAGEKAKSDF